MAGATLLPFIEHCPTTCQVEEEMRRVWPDCAASMHLSIWGVLRYREVLTQRQFIEKMKDPEMKRLL
jgi:hypothetical protein